MNQYDGIAKHDNDRRKQKAESEEELFRGTITRIPEDGTGVGLRLQTGPAVEFKEWDSHYAVGEEPAEGDH